MSISTTINLYEQLGLRDFASSTEVTAQIENMTAPELNELDTAIQILTTPALKHAFDLLLEAWNRPDRLIPRFAHSDDANVVHQVASRLDLRLKEVFPNTFEIATGTTEVDRASRILNDQELSIRIGGKEYSIHAMPFRAHVDAFSRQVYLDIEDDNYGGISLVSDEVVQKKTRSDDEGIVFQLLAMDSDNRLNAAIYNSSQNICSPLAASGRYLFKKNGQEIASCFQIRNSRDRIAQLIRTYYTDLASALPKIDARIDRKSTLKSFLKYSERHFR